MGYVFLNNLTNPIYNVDNKIYLTPTPAPDEYILTYTTSGSSMTKYTLDIDYFDPVCGITFEVYGEGNEGGVIGSDTHVTAGGSGGNYMKSVYTGGTYDGSTFNWNENYTRFYIDIFWKVRISQYQVWNYNRVTPISIPGRYFYPPESDYINGEFDLCSSRNAIYNNNTGYTFLTDIQINNRGGLGGDGYSTENWFGKRLYVGGGGAEAAGPSGNGNNGFDGSPIDGWGYGATGTTGGGYGGNGKNAGYNGATIPAYPPYGAGLDGQYPSGGGGGSSYDIISNLSSNPGLGKIVVKYYGYTI